MAGGHNLVRIERSYRHNFFHFGDDYPAGRGHERVEIALSAAVNEVAGRVGPPCPHQRKIGTKGRNVEVVTAVYLPHLAPLGQRCASGRGGVKAAQTRPTGANRLSQTPLGQ